MVEAWRPAANHDHASSTTLLYNEMKADMSGQVCMSTKQAHVNV